MMDILFLIVVGIGIAIGLSLAIRPKWHADRYAARGGTGAFADPGKTRLWGIALVVINALVIYLRNFS